MTQPGTYIAKRIRARQARSLQHRHSAITEAELDLMIEDYVERGMSFRDLATKYVHKYTAIHTAFTRRDPSIIRWNAKRPSMTPEKVAEMRGRAAPPAEVVAEAVRATNEPRPLVGWMMGDPPPSRSALAQKQLRVVTT
jgi:hypothetical protein